MPQFNPEFFSSQILWTLLSFGVLYYALKRWVLPILDRILEQRANLLQDNLDQAKQQLDHANQLKQEYENRLKNIEEDAAKIYQETELKISRYRQQLIDEWKQERARRERMFKDELEISKQQAMRDIRLQMAEMVVDTTEKLIHQEITVDTIQEMLKEETTELRQKKLN